MIEDRAAICFTRHFYLSLTSGHTVQGAFDAAQAAVRALSLQLVELSSRLSHTCTHTCTHAHMHAHMHTCTHARMHALHALHACTHARIPYTQVRAMPSRLAEIEYSKFVLLGTGDHTQVGK